MNDKKVIRILVADDHRVVREGLRALIDTEPGMEVIGEAVDGVQVVLKERELEPDVILLDLVMPGQDGIEAIRQITRQNPSARILVITSFAEDEKVFPAIKAGALGYLLKDFTPNELLEAIRDVHRGKPSLHATIALKLMRELSPAQESPPTELELTARELEVLKLVAQGLTNKQIADAMAISERTVNSHTGSILSKLHLANRTQAALYAMREGLVE
ncbi:MAG: response regulator transcription factor [Anaerolineales bacterium]|nr:response regulator transcription factor [Anaerolineales bacterium]